MMIKELSTEKKLNYLFWTLSIILVAIGIFLRFYDLELRPIHHDESLHLLTSKYYFTSPSTLFYKYDPMLHGPLLYHLVPYFYWIFDVSVHSGRMLAAILGSFFLLTPLFFYRKLNRTIILLTLATLSLSPTFTYWARFLREDYLVLCSMLLMFTSVLLFKNPHKIYGFLIGLSLHLCIKENSYITIFHLLFYLAYETLYLHFLKSSHISYWRTLFNYLKTWRLHLLNAFVVSAFIYCYYYSSEFRYLEGILDGLYRKSLAYWFNQHSMERLSGPFSFASMIVLLYEPLIVIALAVILIQTVRRLDFYSRLGVIISTLVAFVFYLLVKMGPLSLKLFSFFKLKLPIDLSLLIVQIAFGFFITHGHMKKGQQHLAFFSYLFFATLFTYSYVGEKVPWLALYPQTTAILYIVAIAHKYELLSFRKSPTLITLIFVLVVGFNVHKNYLTNFKFAGKASELLSQVHTTDEFDALIKKAQHEEATNIGPVISIHNDVAWPTSWYFWGSEKVLFNAPLETAKTAKYVISNNLKEPNNGEMLATHAHSQLNFRWWWVPDYRQATPKNILKNILFNEAWSITGSMYVNLYTKKH